MKKITLNKKVVQILSDVADYVEQENYVPNSPMFPFVVCFEWVDEQGEPVSEQVEVLRISVCLAWNDYFIENKENGSFDKLRKRLRLLMRYLEVEVKDGRIK